MSWFHISRLAINWSRNIPINSSIRREVHSIISLLDLYTVIFSCIFFIDRLEFHHSDIITLFYLSEQTVVKSRSTVQRSYLLLCQLVDFVFRHNENIATFFEILFVYLVVSVVRGLRLLLFFSKSKANCSWLY